MALAIDQMKDIPLNGDCSARQRFVSDILHINTINAVGVVTVYYFNQPKFTVNDVEICLIDLRSWIYGPKHGSYLLQ